MRCFGSEVSLLRFCLGTEMTEADTEGSKTAADADSGTLAFSMGLAGLGQVMSWDAMQTNSRILWYKYHCRSNGKPGGATLVGPMLPGMVLASCSI